MIKHYALAMVNKSTGEIDHIATSNAPLSDDMVGKPQGWELTHNLKRFEFEAEPDNGHAIMRGRTALAEFSIKAGKIEAKTKAQKVIEDRDYATQKAEVAALDNKKPIAKK